MKRILPLMLAALLAQPLLHAQYALDAEKLCAPEKYEYRYIDTLVLGGGGYKLVTEMYLPVTDEPFPVVVMRTPYLNFPVQDCFPGMRDYARHGIGFILQRCRGTGGSEGVYEPNIYEREDGLALLQWLQEAPWCSAIGLTGASYMGLTCWIVADAVPEKVKGIYLEHYGVDRHLSAYNSGAFRQDILTAWAIDNAKEVARKPEKDPSAPYYAEMRYMPQLSMDEDLLGARLNWYRDWISHTDYTDPYWQEGFWGQLRAIPSKIKVPVTVVAGHFDHHLEGTLLGYTLLSGETRARSRLIVGGWNHNFVTTPEIGAVHDKDFDVDSDCFNWMYGLLVEGKEPEPEVLVYSIGADEWVNMDSWPSDGTKRRTLHLSPDGGLGPESAGGVLSYTYDPENPVMSVGGETLFSSEQQRGSRIQPPVGYRDDILFFRSGPLSAPLTLSGSIRTVLRFRSDCEDSAVTVKISEERADGSTLNIRTGIATLAFREDRLGARGSYTPGEWVDVTVEMLPIAWELQAGSRIRVDVSSSDFPQYSIHSNYPGVWSGQTRTRIAHQDLDCRESRLILPIRPLFED